MSPSARIAGALTTAIVCVAQLLVSDSSHATCFAQAGNRYDVDPALLRAVAEQESSLNPRAIHRNADGSWDVGLMQINSRWLPTLARHGVAAEDLWDPCTNVMVGAWVLGSNFVTMGRTLNALGAYNASSPDKRARYARQVLARLRLHSVFFTKEELSHHAIVHAPGSQQ